LLPVRPEVALLSPPTSGGKISKVTSLLNSANALITSLVPRPPLLCGLGMRIEHYKGQFLPPYVTGYEKRDHIAHFLNFHFHFKTLTT